MSISYGECEVNNGATANAAYNAAYQQAVTEGVSLFVAAGDNGASGCSPSAYWALDGIGVSGLASTPYNVAVGGTDFGDTYADTNSAYWSPTNTSTYGSALSYIPEIPWNDSCASLLRAKSYGYSVTYGDDGFCYSAYGMLFWNDTAGSGGPSGCATGERLQPGIVGGTCAGWQKPKWQSLVGVPRDGVRDLPDVSLFASDGSWLHFYPICFSDPGNYGLPCSGPPDTWVEAGGTSFASPIMAGFQALVNQKSGERQGNPNSTYYSLAAKEYGASGNHSCNSTLGKSAANSCIFYDVTLGDIDIDCQGYNCYWPNQSESTPLDPTVGSLTTDSTGKTYQTAYASAIGWDFATGIGSVNVANLVNKWPTGTTPRFTLSATPNAVTITKGGSGTSTITITPVNKFSSNVSLAATGLPKGVTASFSPDPATKSSVLTLTASTTAKLGTTTVIVSGTSSSLSATTTITLTGN